jgi:transcriptional regulator with XRE-family HTH domain
MFVTNECVAGELIAQIRHTAGLSQAELARRCGVQRSVLSAYEHGRRQPSVAALARIARAAGMELEISPLSDKAALERAGSVLIDVLDLADRMPSRPRGELSYPPLMRLAA